MGVWDRWLGTAMVCAAMLLPAAAAQAQDEGEDEQGSADPPVQDASSLGTGAVERDLELYWGGKRDVSAVQDKIYTKAGRLELGAFLGMIPNDPFYTYIPVGGRVGYHFTDSLGLEVGGAWHGEALQSESELATFLVDSRGVTPANDLRDIQQWRANAVILWSPFYGKLALLQRKLSHFDLYLAAGGGVVATTAPNADRDGSTDEVKPEGIFGLGMRFFLTPSLSVRADYRQGIFEGTGDEGGVQVPAQLTLGVSWLTGG